MQTHRFTSFVLGRRERLALGGLLLLIAAGCETPSRQVVYVPEEAPVVQESAPVVIAPLIDDEERHRRYVADILFDGMRALRADRLMTPPEQSAYHYFNRALALDPGNPVALEGLQDILQRYLQLAQTASHQGQFANAETFLRRAAQVDHSHPGINAGYAAMERERQRTHSVLVLNAQALRGRQASVSSQLKDLANVVAEIDAFVLITAPNDESGRWIYAQLQDALSNYRVRGDIEIGEQPTVRLVLPQANS